MASLKININQVNADFKNIKDAIVNNGVEIVEGTRTAEYASKIDDVYKAGHDEFWDTFQDNGNRTIYINAFSRWGDVEMLSPKYKVVATRNSSAMFNGSKIKNIDKNKFDLSQATYAPTSSSSTTYCICEYCNYLEVFPDINLQAGYYAFAFNDCFRLHTIEILRVTKECIFATAFRSCEALKNITIEGEIGNSFDLHWSTKLSKESIRGRLATEEEIAMGKNLFTSTIDGNTYYGGIINVLSDTQGATLTLSRTAVDNAFGSIDSTEWVELITPKSNQYNGLWTISLV